MSILTSTSTGISSLVQNWCKEKLSGKSTQYRIEKSSDGTMKVIIRVPYEGTLIIIDCRGLCCKLYFENKPNVILMNMNDSCVKYISPRVKFFCDSIRFSSSVFTEKSTEFIMKYKHDISSSYIVIHHDRELARAFLNMEPYNKLFVENNVKVIFSEEEEEEDELTFKDIINQNFKSESEKVQKYILERLANSYLSKFNEKIKF